MKDLILFPFNGNAREALGVVDAINRVVPTWNFLGFVDDNEGVHGDLFAGHAVIGGQDVLDRRPSAYVVALPGRAENFQRRAPIIKALPVNAERWATLIHPAAVIGPACHVGSNTVLMAGVVLTAGVTVGSHCLIMSNTVIAHETVVGDFSLIGSNVSVSGGVTIQENCYIGTGTRIIQELEIGSQALVGLGAVVVRSVEPRTVVAGCPAKRIRGVAI